MAKIAADLEHALTQRDAHGAAGRTTGRLLARSDGWTVEDVICTSGPADRPFEEQHSGVSIAIVAAGTFQYRSTPGRALMTPGALLLGNAGHCFECGHEHDTGDRCIAFSYAPEYFERIAADAGASGRAVTFGSPCLPPLRDSAPVVAQACAGLVGDDDVSWEEIGVRLAARVAQLASGTIRAPADAPPSAVARVTRAVRAIERAPSARLTLRRLADEAGLSPYHFLRTFERLTGVTPHQYVRRLRLRDAAVRLAVERSKVIDIAFESGFGDVSNFNRAFRAEFGVSPRSYRSGG
ncbi:MAG: AraC family transcriptional regulator [Gemmatimonadota bacterium]|nr:AraC family transcriptional regulator [Gemmatimonadota bacterium]